jgi:ferredoxin-thioredoxin reductase catalytic subunit
MAEKTKVNETDEEVEVKDGKTNVKLKIVCNCVYKFELSKYGKRHNLEITCTKEGYKKLARQEKVVDQFDIMRLEDNLKNGIRNYPCEFVIGINPEDKTEYYYYVIHLSPMRPLLLKVKGGQKSYLKEFLFDKEGK